jgi:hypothetical protein
VASPWTYWGSAMTPPLPLYGSDITRVVPYLSLGEAPFLLKESWINESIIIDPGRFMQGMDEESLERLFLHQYWSISILFGFSFEYTWPIYFKLVYSCMCLSIVPSIFVNEFV